MKNTLQVKTYAIISRAVDEGVEAGWKRAHKHDDKPDAAFLREQICDAVMNELDAVLIFPEIE